jgi:hypothetical protein
MGIVSLLVSCKKNSPPNPSVNSDKPTILTIGVSDIDSVDLTITLNGEVANEGNSATTIRGFCWSYLKDPSVSDSVIRCAYGIGKFSFKIKLLSSDTNFHFRAFATNSFGTSYGKEIVFRINSKSPSILTGNATSINDTTAIINGILIDNGRSNIKESGIIWSLDPNPEIGNSTKVLSSLSLPNIGGKITGLYPGKKYYYRNYAINNVAIGYGSVLFFNTTSKTIYPTIIVNDGIDSLTVSSSADTINIKVLATAKYVNKIKSIAITRQVNSGVVVPIFSLNSYNNKVYSNSYKDYIKGSLSLKDGDFITYKINVTDDSSNSTIAIYKVNVQTINASPQILLGAPNNTVNLYRFFGIKDSYRRYGVGNIDDTRSNSQKIDFLYFFNIVGSWQNVIFSPDYPFTPGTFWGSLTSTWSHKNSTIFKLTPSITASMFDAMDDGVSFLTQLNAIDFSAGTQNSVAVLAVGQVFAFKKSDGKRGFIRVVSIASNPSGQVELLCKTEN